MGKVILDYDSNDMLFTVSDDMAFDSKGNMIWRLSDCTAMDMATGKLHLVSDWSNDEDDK